MSSVVLGTSIQKVDIGVSPIDLTQKIFEGVTEATT